MLRLRFPPNVSLEEIMNTLIPRDPYQWQQIIRPQKADSAHLTSDAYRVYQWILGQHQTFLSYALIAAYRDHSSEWLETFKSHALSSFINPAKALQDPTIDQEMRDVCEEVAYYRKLISDLNLPVLIQQLSLL